MPQSKYVRPRTYGCFRIPPGTGGGAERLEAYRVPAQKLKKQFAAGAPCE
jgi:hypothetical protein